MTAELGDSWTDEHLPQPSLRLGLLACAPLFFLYELGLAAGSGTGRNAAELALGTVLGPLGPLEAPVRWVGVVVLLGWAAIGAGERTESVQHSVGRILLEGLVAAIAMGPVLAGLTVFFDAHGLVFDLPAGTPESAPDLARASRLLGAAVWEELLFRVAAYGIVYLLVARAARFLGTARTIAGWIADLAAMLGSSLFFAVFHLAAFQRWLGHGGEAFDAEVFLWRLLAGLFLAGLFRWRGLGVCAWAHGLFNLGLVLGAGPGVFRSG